MRRDNVAANSGGVVTLMTIVVLAIVKVSVQVAALVLVLLLVGTSEASSPILCLIKCLSIENSCSVLLCVFSHLKTATTTMGHVEEPSEWTF